MPDFTDIKIEFLVTIGLPEEVKKKIHEVKTNFREKYGEQILSSGTHISILKVNADKSLENTILAKLHEFCISEKEIELMLRDFNFFPFHTIYISIKEEKKILNLRNKIIESLKKRIDPSKLEITLLKTPHITIARGLNSEQYKKVYSEYKSKSFQSSVKANTLIIFKRSTNKGLKDDVQEFAKIFQFKGGNDMDAGDQYSIFS